MTRKATVEVVYSLPQRGVTQLMKNKGKAENNKGTEETNKIRIRLKEGNTE
jgi:hypothetical protein